MSNNDDAGPSFGQTSNQGGNGRCVVVVLAQRRFIEDHPWTACRESCGESNTLPYHERKLKRVLVKHSGQAHGVDGEVNERLLSILTITGSRRT